MLREDIKSMRMKLTEYSHGGIVLNSDQVNAFIDNLKSCEDQAQALENSRVQLQAELTIQHLQCDNIVQFPIAGRPCLQDGVAS